jgi:hypothetical protein
MVRRWVGFIKIEEMRLGGLKEEFSGIIEVDSKSAIVEEIT